MGEINVSKTSCKPKLYVDLIPGTPKGCLSTWEAVLQLIGFVCFLYALKCTKLDSYFT